MSLKRWVTSEVIDASTIDLGSVALELVDHYLGNEHIEPPLKYQDTDRDDQSLAVAPLRKVQPGRGVYQEVEHKTDVSRCSAAHVSLLM